MIAPQYLDPSTLPALPLTNRREFPETTCIYFAIDSLGAVQYIGQSTNLRQRWAGHHKQEQLEKMSKVRVAWLEVSDRTMLVEVEQALIAWFKPPLNGRPGFRTNQGTFKVTLTIKHLWPRGLSLEQAEEEMEAMGIHLNRRSLSNLRRGTESGEWSTPYKLAKYLSAKLGRPVSPQEFFIVENQPTK